MTLVSTSDLSVSRSGCWGCQQSILRSSSARLMVLLSCVQAEYMASPQWQGTHKMNFARQALIAQALAHIMCMLSSQPSAMHMALAGMKLAGQALMTQALAHTSLHARP